MAYIQNPLQMNSSTQARILINLTITGIGMMMPLGSGDFSGDGIPEIVYGMQFTDLKKVLL